MDRIDKIDKMKSKKKAEQNLVNPVNPVQENRVQDTLPCGQGSELPTPLTVGLQFSLSSPAIRRTCFSKMET